jgi:hypothetical protein
MPNDCQCLRNARISLAPNSSMRLIVAVIATDARRTTLAEHHDLPFRPNGPDSSAPINDLYLRRASNCIASRQQPYP